tara:strand:+ start:68 stop:1207 length:1140 start_codon:yes stop_codon:yes gene_type:complete
MNVNFNYGNWRNARNMQARSNRVLMRQLKLPYTWENAQTMKKVDRIIRSISQANLQKFYRRTNEVPKRELDRIKRELGKALGRTANNRDVYFIFASAWGTNYFGGYTPNDNIEKDTNFRSPGWNNVNRDDVVGRLATKFGRDTSKAELTRFKKAFFRKIARGTPRDLETLKRILRSTPILYPAQYGNISGVNNLRGWNLAIRSIRNAANYVYGQNGLRNNNNSNDNYNSNDSRNSGPSNSNRSAKYITNTNRVRRNAIRNAVNRNIEWQTKVVNTLPRDAVSLQNFKNGSKAVNIGYNRYVSPATFRTLARTSMIQAYNRNGNAVLFQNPFTRTNLKRSNLKFVVFRTKNAAARKIQKAFRSRPRAKAAMAALKRKRAV